MGLTQLISLAGGLALFLYGMHMMSIGLEKTAGDKLKGILERLTKTPLLGVVVGAVITAIIQSSSASTVMVVGFVNAKMMSIFNAVWIIMGANIGTTITGQLVALNITKIAPILAFIGVGCIIFVKRKQINYFGEILAGLGILFIGMNYMSQAMVPLQSNVDFIGMMTKFEHPLYGIVTGAIFTAVIQSSSASVGILQALAMSGTISFESSVFILFGQNIGTCITALIASMNGDRNGKRIVMIHILFNIIGTAIFTVGCLLFPITDWVRGITPTNPMSQIANMHTIFNVVTTILLFPFGKKLAMLSTRLLPDKEIKKKNTNKNDYFSLGTSAIAIEELKKEVLGMYELSILNFKAALAQIYDFSITKQQEIEKTEDMIDVMNLQIAKRIMKISAADISYKEREIFASFMRVISNIERIGDHALNLSEYGEAIKRNGLIIKNEKEEITALCEIIENSMVHIRSLQMVEQNETQIDALRLYYREGQFEQMKTKNYNLKLGVIYDEILTDLERISDHLLNIAQENNLHHVWKL